MSDQSQPMPPAQPPRRQAGGPGGPAGPPPPGPPGGGHGPAEPPGRQPGLWGQATSTTGGRIATAVALALTGLLLLGVMAVGIFSIARIGDRWDDRREGVSQLRDGRGMGPGGRFDSDDDLGDRGRGMGPGGGQLGRLGGVEHGEFTVTGTDGKPVVMTLQRGVVTAASATSVAVRSTDGFAQTYAVNAQTRVARGTAADVRAGDEVVVLARKEGKVAVQIRPDRR